jgi:hypothetical protein
MYVTKKNLPEISKIHTLYEKLIALYPRCRVPCFSYAVTAKKLATLIWHKFYNGNRRHCLSIGQKYDLHITRVIIWLSVYIILRFRKPKFENGISVKYKMKKNIYQESFEIVRLYNVFVSNYGVIINRSRRWWRSWMCRKLYNMSETSIADR